MTSNSPERLTPTSYFPARTLAAVLICALGTIGAPAGIAGNITYDIANYPINQANYYVGGTDVLSGTIVTDGSMGTLSAADIVGGSYTITDPGVGLENGNTYTQLFLPPSPYTFQFVLTDFTASPTELTLPSGGLFEHFFSGPQNPPLTLTGYLKYGNNFQGGNTFYECGNPSSAGFFTSNITEAAPGSIADDNPWIIATVAPVPEPASSVPVVAAAVFFALCAAVGLCARM